MTKLIIINADDYGLTDGICDAINELADLHAITNTTMMLCAPGAPDRICKNMTNAVNRVAGVHLQLTSGSPVLPKQKVPSLTDNDGTFKNPRDHNVDINEVNIEWRAQIDLAIKLLGHSPTHIDSHHGMHRNFEFFDIYKAIANDYALPFRGAVNELREDIVRDRLRATSAIVRNWTSSCTGALGLVNEIERVAERFPCSNAIEVVTHPGISNDELRQVSSLNDKRECDLHGLMEAQEKMLIEKMGYSKVCFSKVKDFARPLQ